MFLRTHHLYIYNNGITWYIHYNLNIYSQRLHSLFSSLNYKSIPLIPPPTLHILNAYFQTHHTDFNHIQIHFWKEHLVDKDFKSDRMINDAMQKYAMGIYKPGDNPLNGLHIQTAGFKTAVPNEVPIRLNHRIDYAFIDTDDILHNVEFQSQFNESDSARFQLYNAALYFTYRDEVNYVVSYIVYPSHIRPKPTYVMQLTQGSLIFEPTLIFLHDYYAEDELSDILTKSEKGTMISNNDVSTLIFSLLMNRRSTFKELALKVFSIARNIEDKNRQEEVAGYIKSHVEKHISQEERTKLEEAIEVTFKEMLQQREDKGLERGLEQGLERGLEQGEEKKLCALITKKLAKGKQIPTIANELEETEQTIKSLIEKHRLGNESS